jgi:opacity protein-like surface antigen
MGIWVNGGYSLISGGGIGTDQLTGGASNDLQATGGALFTVRFDLDQGNHMGHEIQYMNSRMPLQYNYEAGMPKEGAAINRGGYNFLAYFNGRESRVRLFATLGAELTHFARPSDSAIGCESSDCTVASQPPTTGGNNKFGLNYGAGVKASITSRFGIRFDVRQYVDTKPFDLRLASGLFRQTEISAGFGVSF